MPIAIVSQGKDLKPWIKALKNIKQDIDIRIYPNDLNKKDVEFALSWNHQEGVFKNYPNIKCITSMGAGVDHLLKDHFLPKNILISRLVDPNLTQDMFEFVLASVMNYLKGFSQYENDKYQKIWNPVSYKNIKETKIGIMGLGVIGSFVSSQLSNIGFEVSGWSNSFKKIDGVKSYFRNKQLKDFLKNSDILICLLPLTKETQGILNKTTFEQLPDKAYIINVARGGHLVETDLIEMIDKGKLSGAHLDVFPNEPLPKDHKFWSHSKIIITPHVASLTKPESVAPQIIENYKRLKSGQSLLNLVSIEKGY